MKITPALKGLITGMLMIAVFLSIFYVGDHSSSKFQSLVYLIYGLGIWWTIYFYTRTANFKGKFGEIFQQGFRCFVVVTLIVAMFYGIFNYMHPEFAEASSVEYRKQLEEGKQRLPTEIDSDIATYKKQYTLKLVSGAIFGYLIIGAGVTAILSALYIKKR